MGEASLFVKGKDICHLSEEKRWLLNMFGGRVSGGKEGLIVAYFVKDCFGENVTMCFIAVWSCDLTTN